MAHIKTKYDKESTRNNRRQFISSMLRHINKDYTKTTIKDIDGHLNTMKPTSVEAMKPVIRKFFTFMKKPERISLPCLR